MRYALLQKEQPLYRVCSSRVKWLRVCEAAWLVCCSGNLTHISVEGELHNGQGGGVARLGKVWGGLLEVGQYV